MSGLLIRRGELGETRVAATAPAAPGPGEALLRVGSFGMTANNVTYAMFGEAMSYWDFFPVEEEGWGRLPVWGFATVEASEAEGVEVGTRVYGYLPAATHLLVTPADAGPAGFVDAAPHRAELPSAYQRYLATAADPFYASGTEDVQMLLRPLFFTSFLLDDQLDDDGLAAGAPLLLASASSKTAIAAAYLLARRPGVELIGLTSARNVEFVAGLGLYDRAVAYEDLDSLAGGAATFVDFAGAAAVRAAVHARFGDALRASIAVGMTHWDAAAGGGELPGPTPSFFFAPTRVTKRAADWGRAGLEARVAEAWGPFGEWIGERLEVVRGAGIEGARDAYLEVLGGGVPPDRAHVIALG